MNGVVKGIVLISLTTYACNNAQVTSSLSVDSTVAVSPPPTDFKKAIKMSKYSASSSNEDYICVDGVCRPKTEAEKALDRLKIENNSTPPSSKSEQKFAEITVNQNSEKLYTGGKDQYYQPVEGMSGIYQNRNEKGPTGYYWNKNDNTLFKFSDPTKSGFDPKTKQPIFSAEDQIFKLKETNGIWHGDQVDSNNNPKGLFYEYGPKSSSNGSYGFVYGINRKQLVDESMQNRFGMPEHEGSKGISNEKLNGSEASRALLGRNSTIYLNQNPYLVGELNQNMLIQPDVYSNFFTPRVSTQRPQQQNNQPIINNSTQRPQIQPSQNRVNGQSRYLLVSASDCGACPGAKTNASLLQSQGYNVSVYEDRTYTNPQNPYGVRAFPTWIIYNSQGQEIGRKTGQKP